MIKKIKNFLEKVTLKTSGFNHDINLINEIEEIKLYSGGIRLKRKGLTYSVSCGMNGFLDYIYEQNMVIDEFYHFIYDLFIVYGTRYHIQNEIVS